MGCHPGYHTGIWVVTLVTIQVYGLSPCLPYRYLGCHPGYHTGPPWLAYMYMGCPPWLPYTVTGIWVVTLVSIQVYGLSTLVTIHCNRYLGCHPGYHTGIWVFHPGYHTGIWVVTLFTIHVFGLSPWLPYRYMGCYPVYHTGIWVVTMVTIQIYGLSTWLPYMYLVCHPGYHTGPPWLPYRSWLPLPYR